MLQSANKKTYELPSYERCVEICKQAGETVFYEKSYIVDGYKISTFNYMLAQYTDFVEYQAYEMRGLTFVFNLDGSLYKRFVLLRKFFNLNQVAETQLDLVKDVPLNSVYLKEDGSVISFFDLPNGRILSKSKMESDNYQAQLSYEVYEKDENIQRLVRFSLDNNISPIFELVSPKNRIVLQYTQTDLILLRLRNNETGSYIDFCDLPDGMLDGIKTPLDFSSVYNTWESLVAHVLETEEEIEGYVVDCGGDLMKIKTQWYCDRHHLTTGDAWREDYIIGLVMDGTLDDVLSQLNESDTELRQHMQHIEKITVEYITNAVNETREMVSKEYTGDKKAFALAFKKHPMFNRCMAQINGYDLVEFITKQVKSFTYYLSNSREFVDTKKVNGV